jgi:hypothetical protein
LHRQSTFQGKNQKHSKYADTVYIVTGSWRFPFRRYFARFLNGSWRFWYFAGFDSALVEPLHRSNTFLENTRTMLQISRHSMYSEWGWRLSFHSELCMIYLSFASLCSAPWDVFTIDFQL